MLNVGRGRSLLNDSFLAANRSTTYVILRCDMVLYAGGALNSSLFLESIRVIALIDLYDENSSEL